MSNEMQASNLLQFSSGQSVARIKDERHENGSPESPGLNTGSSSSSKEQDRFLPIANVGRIMKKVIPTSGKISKDAKETVQECVSEFISFVTGEASDKCQREKRKTINGDDIIWAITTLGFEDYVGPLKVYLTKYRELEGEKMNIPKQLQPQRMHPRPDQMAVFGGGLAPYPSPVGLFSSQRTLAHQPPYVATDQPFSSPFSLQKPYHHHHTEQIDHW